jgi:hypothetical protein
MGVSGGDHMDFLAAYEFFPFSILCCGHESAGGIQSDVRNV